MNVFVDMGGKKICQCVSCRRTQTLTSTPLNTTNAPAGVILFRISNTILLRSAKDPFFEKSALFWGIDKSRRGAEIINTGKPEKCAERVSS